MVKITVGMATCGVSAGAARVFETFRGLIDNDGGRATLQATGCLGMCYREPLVEIDDGTDKYLYGEVDEKKARDRAGVPVRVPPLRAHPLSARAAASCLRFSALPWAPP